MPRTFVFTLAASMILSAGARANEAPQAEPAGGAAEAAPDSQPAASQTPAAPNSAGAAFADFDSDGRVDLYITNIVDQVAHSRPQPLSEYWVGIDATPPDDALRAQLDLPAGQGLVINQIVAGSAAEKAGLKPYDVLISCNDVPLKEIGDLAKIIEQKKESALTLRLVRAGKRSTVEVTPQRRPASQTGATCPAVSKVDDREFVGRVWTDLLGTVPEQNEVESFLNETRADKREWLVNRLLRSSTTAAKSCTDCHADDVQGWKLFQGMGVVPHWDATVFRSPENAFNGYIKRIVNVPDVLFEVAQAPQSLPDDVSVSITYQKGQPAKVTVKQGEQTWEATAADYREKLPEHLRGCVDALLPAGQPAGAAGPQHHLKWTLDRLAPHDGHVRWKRYTSSFQPQQLTTPAQTAPSESAIEKLDKQIESLASQLGDLRKAMQELRQAMQGPSKPDDGK